MKCIICKATMVYFFSKEYLAEPYKSFMKDIENVDYFKCNNCGFVFSKTHSELPCDVWKNLNYEYHHYDELEKSKKYKCTTYPPPLFVATGNPPPYLEQATMISILSKNEIIDSSDMLDFAGGYGTESKLLQKYYNLKMNVYDPYVNKTNTEYVNNLAEKKYKVVFNSAMFEHVRNRQDLENVNDLVAQDGCLILHTLICEKIPRNPDWFYLFPVHCAFHTNKSMEILMKQWGYSCSIYCPTSKCWILFKEESDSYYNKASDINAELQNNYLYYKKGFVDYWKGF